MNISSKKDSGKADDISELAVLHWEAERFVEKLHTEVKTITEVFEAKELLTPATLLRCNVAIMIVHQLAANIERIAKTIRDKLPTNHHDSDVDMWISLSSQLVSESRKISDLAISQAKEISRWASVRIDGTVYPSKAV